MIKFFSWMFGWKTFYDLGVKHGREIAGEEDAIEATQRFISRFVEENGIPIKDEQIHEWIKQDGGSGYLIHE